jgi:hypothetical protein
MSIDPFKGGRAFVHGHVAAEGPLVARTMVGRMMVPGVPAQCILNG